MPRPSYRLDLTGKEFHYLRAKLSVELLAYLGHKMVGVKLSPDEEQKLEWLRALDERFAWVLRIKRAKTEGRKRRQQNPPQQNEAGW